MTEIQKKLLRYVAWYNAKNGYQPTQTEIANHLGLKSPSSIGYILEPLIANGRVKFKGPRAIVDTENKIDFVGFADAVLSIVWDGYELDGGVVQKLGIKHGILEKIIATKPCGENCNCEILADFPCTCYRKTYIE